GDFHFFFQAEDGIRDFHVTGVQTCALPISAEILAELIESLPKKVRVGLHVCGGNPRRKRVYFTKYIDLVEAFKAVPIDEVMLEHCTLSYNMLELFDIWDFKGDLAIGVIDQRSDALESIEEIRQRLKPALDYFPAD